MKQKNNNYLFLLYVSVMLIITFLQQEFVLIPQLRGLDIVEENTKALILEKFQQWRWVSFLLPPILLLVTVSLVSLCLFVGSFFFSGMGEMKFGDWWGIAIQAQAVMVAYSVVLCVINIISGPDAALRMSDYTSLTFLGETDMDNWIKIPLSAVNVFEIIYWLVMSYTVSRKANNRFWTSFKFVMSSYGIGYLFYIVFLMFLTLYLA